MRTICDVCENAAAVLFCAADEAALCRSCDDKLCFLYRRSVSWCILHPRKKYEEKEKSFTILKVHMCNKLASRHIRVGLADPSEVPRCDICENAPAFFYCDIDGTSLCLQCDMIVHVGGKRTHRRYLLLRQRVEFPGNRQGQIDDANMQCKDQTENGQVQNHIVKQNLQNSKAQTVPEIDGDDHVNSNMIDLNTRPYRNLGQASNSRSQGMDYQSSNHDNGS